MNATLKRLIEERATQATFIEELLAHVEGENRDLVAAERSNLEAAEQRMAELDAQIEPLQKFEQRRAAAVVITEAGTTPPARPVTQGAETRSLGALYTESEEFRSFAGRGTSQITRIPEFRAVIKTTEEPGSVLISNSQRYMVPEHYGPFPLLQLVSTVEVTSNAVEIIKVGDATGANRVSEGLQKPEVTWSASAETVTLETIAGWTKYSRQALADIPQLRSLIDQKIRRAIDVRLHALAATALETAFTPANTTTGAAGASLLALIRGAIAELQERGVAPSAVALNPQDYAAIDLELLGKPLGSASINGSFWGLAPVPVSTITPGEAVIGDIGEALSWFYKAGLEMYTTDSDVSFQPAGLSDFRANILTTLGEVRGIFAVTDASTLQKVVATP